MQCSLSLSKWCRLCTTVSCWYWSEWIWCRSGGNVGEVRRWSLPTWWNQHSGGRSWLWYQRRRRQILDACNVSSLAQCHHRDTVIPRRHQRSIFYYDLVSISQSAWLTLSKYQTLPCLALIKIFAARRSYASAVLEVLILSISPSVCPTHVLCDKTKQCTVDILILHERAITLVFWHQQWLVGDAPFRLKSTHRMRRAVSARAELLVNSQYRLCTSVMTKYHVYSPCFYWAQAAPTINSDRN